MNKLKKFENFKSHSFEDLKKILLDEDGSSVQELYEEDLTDLITQGEFYHPNDYTYKIIKMEPSRCHSNCALFYRNYVEDNSEEEISIVTGWALSNNNVWYQHTWIMLLDDAVLIETTEKRKLYYGFILNYEQIQEFLDNNE